MLIQRVSNQRLDNRQTANIQLGSGVVEFL
jgi:hypothetical protein